MPKTLTETAHEFAARLVEVSESYHEGRITHEVFSAKQVSNWVEIELAGMSEPVLAILRGAL